MTTQQNNTIALQNVNADLALAQKAYASLNVEVQSQRDKVYLAKQSVKRASEDKEATAISLEKAESLLKSKQMKVSRSKKPETIEAATKDAEHQQSLVTGLVAKLAECEKKERVAISHLEKMEEKLSGLISETANKANEVTNLKKDSEALNFQLELEREKQVIMLEAQKRAESAREALQGSVSEDDKADDSEALGDIVKDDNAIAELSKAIRSGEQNAGAVNSALQIGLDRLKQTGKFDTIKIPLLMLARAGEQEGSNGFWDKQIPLIKKYIQTFTPYDVVLRKVRANKTSEDKIWKCKLVQKRDLEFWPDRTTYYWEELSTAAKGKAPVTFEKELKRWEGLEIDPDMSESQGLQLLQLVAKQLKVSWAVNLEQLESELLNKINQN